MRIHLIKSFYLRLFFNFIILTLFSFLILAISFKWVSFKMAWTSPKKSSMRRTQWCFPSTTPLIYLYRIQLRAKFKQALIHLEYILDFFFQLHQQLFSSSHHDFLLLLILGYDFKLFMLHNDYQLIFVDIYFFLLIDKILLHLLKFFCLESFLALIFSLVTVIYLFSSWASIRFYLTLPNSSSLWIISLI